MARISTHMDDKAYQVAVGTDKDLPLRKWDHRGTCWRISARDVAYLFGIGDLLGSVCGSRALCQEGVIYIFTSNVVHISRFGGPA